MPHVRLFFVGGMLSYRALFGWLNPWIYIPTMLVAPLFQVLLFVNMGRSAGVESDEFYLVGNAIQYISLPCLAGLANIIAGERFMQTLSILLASPAPRLVLFVGRAVPALVNGIVVAAFALVVGAALVDVSIPLESWPALVVVIIVASASCIGLGLLNAALALRVRETAVSSNLIFGVILLFSGANVALEQMPSWMGTVGALLPLSHAIEAAREVVAGAGLGDVAGLLRTELLIGLVYGAAGLLALRWLERVSRQKATLDRV
ncbi:ABC transporter permease [Nocardioides sp.]|uniref:ABC transporter permease n=1 Tax=Nocardioides sp. TaxID=35761 RepID=UPI00351462B5